MATVTKARTAKARTASPVTKGFTFTGRGAMVRNAALEGVASLAYVAGKSRGDMIAQMRIALGKSPSADELAAVRVQYVAGTVAQKLTRADFTGNAFDAFGKKEAAMTVADRIAFALELMVHYAAPVKDGTKARSIGTKKGRRTVSQDTAIRNAEKGWSLVAGELGIGTAQTQAEKNAKQTRAPSAAGSGKGKAKPTAPSHSELVKAPTIKTAQDVDAHVMAQALALLQFCKKHAGLARVETGLAVAAFHSRVAELIKEAK